VQTLLYSAVLVMLAGVGLVLLRAILGPSLYDRVLAANTMGTQAVILVVLFAFLLDQPWLLDMALLYALINFVATVAILRSRHKARPGEFE
jgi:multicomponent Na+:H+ antiporter subunit F